MADHLLIGILIGMASGIAAVVIISAVTLRRLDSVRRIEAGRVHRALAELQRSSERTERSVRQDLGTAGRELETAMREARDESSASARALRDEIAGGLKAQTDVFAERLAALTETALAALRDHPLPTLSRLAEAQERQLGALAAELRRIQADTRDSLEQLRAEAMGHAKDLRNDMLESLRAHTDAVHAGMDVMAQGQQRQLEAIRADNTRQLEEARTAVEDKLESTLERRLGESFSRVGERLDLLTERLEQVHRGLGEVQTFAAGLGNLQRALANVRLGGTKTRANPAAAEEGDTGPRAVRRKSKRVAGDDGRSAVDPPHASSP